LLIRIKTFAVLKNYFKEDFEINLEDHSSIADAIQHLERLNPNSVNILSHCLTAIEEEMADKFTKLKAGQILYLLPPVSGG